MPNPIGKEALLRQVDGLRDIARRSRRLAEAMTGDTDRERLTRHARELDDRASILEQQAVDARTGQFTASTLPRSTAGQR
jgi:hypothetical protein